MLTAQRLSVQPTVFKSRAYAWMSFYTLRGPIVVFPLFCLSLGGIIITNGRKIKIPISFLSVGMERYRMVEWINAEDPSTDRIYELYDYEVDPLETKNYAQEKPDVLNELKAILARHPQVKPQVRK